MPAVAAITRPAISLEHVTLVYGKDMPIVPSALATEVAAAEEDEPVTKDRTVELPR